MNGDHIDPITEQNVRKSISHGERLHIFDMPFKSDDFTFELYEHPEKLACDGLLIDITKNVALKADISTLASQYTKVACDALVLNINNNVALKADTTALTSQYTKAAADLLLNGKLNDTAGSVSMAIQNNSAADVAVLWNNATKDVELKGTCFVYNNLSVLGATAVGNALTTSAASAIGGSIRVIASTSGNEASVGFYKCTDSRWAVASDMWVAGVKC